MARKKNKLKNLVFGEVKEKQNITIGDDWMLKDLRGNKFGSDTLRGYYYLLYFGSSQCPDVCPLTLHKMSRALRMLELSSEGKQYMKC